MAKAKIGDEITLKGLFDHGRTELAAALLRHNDGHVMYMKGMENPEQDNAQKPMSMDDLRADARQREQAEKGKDAEKGVDGPEQDRGRGR